MPSIIFAKSGKTDSTQIQYGTNVAGSISSPSERDYYTFAGESGDVILIRNTEGKTNFQLRVELFGPDGASLSNESSPGVTELRVVLADSGTHVILVRENGAAIGGYRINIDTDQHLLATADTLSGSGSTEAVLDFVQRKAYLFLASVDSEVLIKMTRLSGFLDPQLELYGPSGELILRTKNGSSAQINSSQFKISGSYLLVASDDIGDNAGTYQLAWSGLLSGSLIQITSVEDLLGIVSVGTATTPQATFTNIGWQEERFAANFQIHDIYDEQIDDIHLLPGQSITLSFPVWVPLIASTYPYSFSSFHQTLLGGDTETGFVVVSKSAKGTGPEIHLVTPRVGLNGGLFTIRLSGRRFEEGVTAILSKQGEPNLVSDSLSTNFISSDTIDVTFDLAEAAEGSGDIKVVNPNSDSYTFFSGFKVLEFEGQELAFGQWEEFNVAKGTSLEVGVNVPLGQEDLFVLVKKSTKIGYSGTWRGNIRLSTEGQEIASKSGNNDFEIHLKQPETGFYTIKIFSSDLGDGQIKVCGALPELKLGEWQKGEVLRPYGWDWFQLDVPANQSTIFFETEGFGIWSTLDIFYEYIGNQEQHWQISRPRNGYHLEGQINNPSAGQYYLRYMDSAVITGADRQRREYLIISDTKPVEQPPPSDVSITGLSTYRGGTAKPVTFVISGSGLDPKASVIFIRDGYENILANKVVGDSTRRSLTATFLLSGAEPGEWVLKVVNLNEQYSVAPKSFTIERVGEPDVWVEIIGRSIIRYGRNFKYIIKFGNRGNVDIYDLVLFINLPKKILITQHFPNIPSIVFDPLKEIGVPWEDFPMIVETNDAQVLPIWLLRLGAGSEFSFEVDVNVPSSLNSNLFWMEADLRIASSSSFSMTGNIDSIATSPIFKIFEDAIVDKYSNSTFVTKTALSYPPPFREKVRKSGQHITNALWNHAVPTWTITGATLGVGYWDFG